LIEKSKSLGPSSQRDKLASLNVLFLL
jgi:hypothetical protein